MLLALIGDFPALSLLPVDVVGTAQGFSALFSCSLGVNVVGTAQGFPAFFSCSLSVDVVGTAQGFPALFSCFLSVNVVGTAQGFPALFSCFLSVDVVGTAQGFPALFLFPQCRCCWHCSRISCSLLARLVLMLLALLRDFLLSSLVPSVSMLLALLKDFLLSSCSLSVDVVGTAQGFPALFLFPQYWCCWHCSRIFCSLLARSVLMLLALLKDFLLSSCTLSVDVVGAAQGFSALFLFPQCWCCWHCSRIFCSLLARSVLMLLALLRDFLLSSCSLSVDVVGAAQGFSALFLHAQCWCCWRCSGIFCSLLARSVLMLLALLRDFLLSPCTLSVDVVGTAQGFSALFLFPQCRCCWRCSGIFCSLLACSVLMLLALLRDFLLSSCSLSVDVVGAAQGFPALFLFPLCWCCWRCSGISCSLLVPSVLMLLALLRDFLLSSCSLSVDVVGAAQGFPALFLFPQCWCCWHCSGISCSLLVLSVLMLLALLRDFLLSSCTLNVDVVGAAQGFPALFLHAQCWCCWRCSGISCSLLACSSAKHLPPLLFKAFLQSLVISVQRFPVLYFLICPVLLLPLVWDHFSSVSLILFGSLAVLCRASGRLRRLLQLRASQLVEIDRARLKDASQLVWIDGPSWTMLANWHMSSDSLCMVGKYF